MQLIPANKGWEQKKKKKSICHSIYNSTLFPCLDNRINWVKHWVEGSKVTWGRKALHMRYMLLTFTSMVKSQSASSQLKMEPWCTNLCTTNKKSFDTWHQFSVFVKYRTSSVNQNTAFSPLPILLSLKGASSETLRRLTKGRVEVKPYGEGILEM